MKKFTKSIIIVSILLISISVPSSAQDLPPGFKVHFNDAPHSNSNDIDVKLAAFIESANVSVEGAFYSIERMTVANAFIAAAQKLGTENVRIITDAGYRSKGGCVAIEAAGITVIDETCDGWSDDSLESHNKFCVIDGQKVWTGSYNITNSGTIYNNNNAVEIDCYALAQTYLAEFNEMWGADSGPPGNCHFSTNKLPHSTHQLVCNGVNLDVYFSPTQETSPDRAVDVILNLMDGASSSLYFCIYTFTSYSIAGKFIQAVDRGITVKGVMDGWQASSSYSQYDFLRTNGVDVIRDDYVTPHGNLLHHKMCVVDYNTSNAAVITGSYNWTTSAQYSNDENTLVIYNQDIAQLYYDEFAQCYYGDAAATPTPVPTAPIIDLEINQDTFSAGNIMQITATITNTADPRTLDEYIILDLGPAFGDDQFYFWPSWTTTPDAKRLILSGGDFLEQEILQAVLPDPLGAAGPFTVWAGLLDPSTNTILGEIDFVVFSFE